jgi:hypothetical protein
MIKAEPGKIRIMRTHPYRPVRHRLAAFSLAGMLALGAMPTFAADEPPPEMDEVIVTAPRNGEPGFQESDQYHRQEYDRLHAKFGKPGRVEPRGDATLSRADMGSSPNNREMATMRQTISDAPSLRDTFSDN